MLESRPADTLMDPNHKFGLQEDDTPVDRERYQRFLGKLINLSHIRPNITFSISVVTQLMQNPMEEHLEAIYKILRYLKTNPGRGLFF